MHAFIYLPLLMYDYLCINNFISRLSIINEQIIIAPLCILNVRIFFFPLCIINAWTFLFHQWINHSLPSEHHQYIPSDNHRCMNNSLPTLLINVWMIFLPLCIIDVWIMENAMTERFIHFCMQCTKQTIWIIDIVQ